ncbi:transcription factor HIVEP3 [Acanthochromis polyacanthus]|uniref:HIVEP zinc finger 3a n=1 Tax=Acanthochromis polyacanthus TaxID=80966 RepID=A0A3Q1FMB8_9TELE|nr:transcription factor HIVEP3 [Acanthochromis polyacanthus]XP_022070936.1 transcription factor HIVEP3 [Acanthochromis polyacanthus]
MEALHSRLTTGEQTGGQEHCQPESPQRGPQPKSPSQPRQQQKTGSPKPHGTQQQPKQSRRQNPERKRLRHQRQSIDSDTSLDTKNEATTATKATAVSSLPSGVLPSTAGGQSQSKPETQEDTPKQKRERKPQRPGKYVCTYCGRACAKPSVLQKHIRSHTGERPYPCAPCGFSFKTKSNLYKHRKSHTHRVKAGLALGEPKSLEEQVTESEDETRQLSSASSLTDRQGSVASIKNCETDVAKDCTGLNNDSYAVKKRLALRLSRGKHAPQDSSDEKTSSLVLGSRGSTESGYFSRSESTEQSQDSPPNTSAKSYAEIILGKYGRLGHLQRMSRQHNQHPSGQEDKSISFTVPKKQVIDHITKLITINEAVVDTSKIDSVKPRRFSLSRKNSGESQKSSCIKEALIHSPKAGDLGYKNSGSITMGVPCEKFHHPSLNVEQPAGQTSTAPLVRSHSMPSAASSFDSSSGGPSKFRLSHSFDERQPSETQPSRRYGMLRRQPAIEIPLGAELTKEEHEGSHSFYSDVTTVPDHQQSQPQPYECEACGTGCKDWEGYKKHKQSLCLAHHPRNEVVVSQMECSQLINHAVRAGSSTMRKRRKEESFEFDDPSSPSLPSPALLSGPCKDESSVAYEGPRRPALQTCSVIQHTSSFEKQESLCNENQSAEVTKNSPPHDDYQLVPQKQPQQQLTKLTTRKLVRQHSVQVPEILVTEDSNTSADTSVEPTSTTKHSEKPDEFQWPQRSPSLAQLPIEKLPPKKKRLRLAEAAQSSGESSFDSISLPRSPSQDSSASYASSRSTSFEEPNRPDMERATSTPLRRSRAPHMLTVPGVHQHREMRRSASEQAPHDPQPSVLMAETRSKSFDYSCLSPERSAVGWRERRKCLLFRHSAIRDPDEEEEEQCNIPSRSPERVSPNRSSQTSPTSVYCSRSSSSPLSGDAFLRNPVGSQSKEIFSQWKLHQNIQLMGSTELPPAHDPSVGVKEEASHIHTEQPLPQAPQPYPTHGPSGAARAHYLPMSTGLKLEIPLQHDDCSEVRVSHAHKQHSVPHITSSLEMLRPVTSPAIAVRLQTDTLTPACAIYTTLSQSTSPRPQEAVDAVSHNISTAEYRNHRNMSPDLQLWSDDGLRLSGSGGNKRMLSPSNSIELPPESQQQQKRVKEEEEREVGCADKATVDTCNQELKQESQSCLPGVSSPVSHVGPSFPSLLSSTCNSWCYLNYIKPNPSALDEQKPSVYSSWSTSGYDPNPPGLSSKTALSLLHCKQRLSPSIYTISPMSVQTTESVEQEDNKRPCLTEVYNSQTHRRDHEGTGKGQTSADHNRSDRKEEKEEEKTQQQQEEEEEEKVHFCSRNKQPPEVWISESGSEKKYGVMHSGGGRKCQSEDAGSHCKSTGVLSTESPPYNCNRCNSTFKAKGICEHQSIHPDQQKHHQCSVQGGDHNDVKDKDDRRKETSRSTVVERSDKEKAHPGGQPMEPEHSPSLPATPKDSTHRGSASARRALFARRRLDASASVSSGGSRSPSTHTVTPQRELSPPCSPSPRPRHSPTPTSSSLSPSSCHVSTAPQRPVSPVRGLSPVILQSQGTDSSGPPGSLADNSAQTLHPRGQPSTARLSVAEVGLTHVTPHPQRPRGAHNLLSHLPLHSQQPSRAPNLLIPIGGIHMIQPRSPLPMYKLVSSPAAAPANPTGTGASRRPSDAPKGRLALPQRWDTLKETLPSSQASPPHPGASGQMPVGARLHRKSQGCFGVQQPSSPGTETRHAEVSRDAPVTERRVYPETTQGQKKAPSSQTQL